MRVKKEKADGKRDAALALSGLILVVTYYVLPLLIRDTGTGMLILLGVAPLLTFFCAFLYGERHGCSLLLAAAAALLFVPTLFLFYDVSAWIYSVAYGTIALIGSGSGSLCRNSKRTA